MHARTIFTSFTVLAMSASLAQADILASYDFSTSQSPAATAPDVSASAFDGVSATNDGSVSGDIGRSGGSQNMFLRTDATAATQPAALDDDDYFQFTIGPDSVPSITVGSITLDHGGGIGSGNTNSFNTTIYLQSSINGFGSANPVLGSASHEVTSAKSLATTTIYLPPAFQSLSSSVTFRIYASDDNDVNNDTVRIDNVIVVPEPASLALMGLGGMVMLRRHSRS